jgi:hypothetical protein
MDDLQSNSRRSQATLIRNIEDLKKQMTELEIRFSNLENQISDITKKLKKSFIL